MPRRRAGSLEFTEGERQIVDALLLSREPDVFRNPSQLSGLTRKAISAPGARKASTNLESSGVLERRPQRGRHQKEETPHYRLRKDLEGLRVLATRHAATLSRAYGPWWIGSFVGAISASAFGRAVLTEELVARVLSEKGVGMSHWYDKTGKRSPPPTGRDQRDNVRVAVLPIPASEGDRARLADVRESERAP